MTSREENSNTESTTKKLTDIDIVIIVFGVIIGGGSIAWSIAATVMYLRQRRQLRLRRANASFKISQNSNILQNSSGPVL